MPRQLFRFQKHSTTGSEAAKKKSTDIVSSDSECDIKKMTSRKRTSGLTTIMEKNDSTAKTIRPKIINTKVIFSTQKTRTSLTRPLPKKP